MERTFSVIIPTLNKRPDITAELISNLSLDNAVNEIIVIDNTDEGVVDYGSDKVSYHKQHKNIYVNPSWDLGVSLSKSEYIALVNDDITIPDNIFSAIASIPMEQLGVLGADQLNILQTDSPSRFSIGSFSVRESNIRNWGFGIFMVMKKENYIFAPKDLMVWCHDDILFHMNRKLGRRNGVFEFPIQTKMSATSDLPEFDLVKQNDLKIYEQYKMENGI